MPEKFFGLPFLLGQESPRRGRNHLRFDQLTRDIKRLKELPQPLHPKTISLIASKEAELSAL